MNRLIIPEAIRAQTERQFDVSAPVEDGVFLLAHTGRTASGLRLVGFEALETPAGAWERQGPDSLAPSAQWLSAAIGRACTEGACLVLAHSHPNPLHPAALSIVDIATMRELAPVIEQITQAPFVLIAVKGGEWSGALSIGGMPAAIDRIDAIGLGLRPLSGPTATEDVLLDDRQIRALGATNAALRSLTVAVVGCGGTGAAVAEQVYRMGVSRILLVDHDTLDTESNVRRMTGSILDDAHKLPHPLKADVVAGHLERIGLPSTTVVPLAGDIRSENVFRAVLDADVVISATDTHGSRAIVNDMCTAYAMPVIDLGARVSTRGAEVEGLWAERRLLTPDRPCLWCSESISAAQIAAEHMDAGRRSGLEAEGYVVGGGTGHEASIVALNAIAAALGTCALPGLLTEAALRMPDRTLIDGMMGVLINLAVPVVESCGCSRNRFKADSARIPFATTVNARGGE